MGTIKREIKGKIVDLKQVEDLPIEVWALETEIVPTKEEELKENTAVIGARKIIKKKSSEEDNGTLDNTNAFGGGL